MQSVINLFFLRDFFWRLGVMKICEQSTQFIVDVFISTGVQNILVSLFRRCWRPCHFVECLHSGGEDWNSFPGHYLFGQFQLRRFSIRLYVQRQNHQGRWSAPRRSRGWGHDSRWHQAPTMRLLKRRRRFHHRLLEDSPPAVRVVEAGDFLLSYFVRQR